MNYFSTLFIQYLFGFIYLKSWFSATCIPSLVFNFFISFFKDIFKSLMFHKFRRVLQYFLFRDFFQNIISNSFIKIYSKGIKETRKDSSMYFDVSTYYIKKCFHKRSELPWVKEKDEKKMRRICWFHVHLHFTVSYKVVRRKKDNIAKKSCFYKKGNAFFLFSTKRTK